MTGLSGDALRAIRSAHTDPGDPKRDAPVRFVLTLQRMSRTLSDDDVDRDPRSRLHRHATG
ncbi:MULTISPECIES: hypothetical protein [Burkholderia]|uniref:Alkylhydroperoxidase n=1 Tax=Burkholderia aenigmatica TaxID=2015348 RepID=A0A6J5IYZ7_9BURK|nr:MULTISPECIES: hypothetical protein [Burkholderia]CAB3963853.1 alkylhydroperoxidase [Burkholderia aenigmatica]